MKHNWTTRALLMLLVICAVLGLGLPVTAQTVPVFVTNTPLPPQPTPLPTALLPEGGIAPYALRLWIERDLLDVLIFHINQLTEDDPRIVRAVQLLQYELEQRFPGAPRDTAGRDRLLEAMLSAPRGTVDMRRVVRAYVQEALNQRQSALNNYNGFNIQVSLLNLDGVSPADALIHTRYPADASTDDALLYEDYVLAQVDSSGAYRLLPAAPDFPAAPFGAVQRITLEKTGDFDGDSLDEVALGIDTGDLNHQLLIYGWRSGTFINLVQPGQTLLFGTLRQWSGDTVRVTQFRTESPAWGCIGELDSAWTFTANFFRPVPQLNPQYAQQDSLACRLYQAEPLYSIPPAEAIGKIEAILANSGSDEPGSEYALQRAQMALAMLYALDGQPTTAIDLVSRMQPEEGSWLESQTTTFFSTISRTGSTAIDLCAALLAAARYGACDIDGVLQRVFSEMPLLRNRPVVEQLEERGLRVINTVTISSIGRADRTAVNLNLFGASWWAFAPIRPDVYTAEIVEAPAGFAPVPPPQGFLDPTQAAYDALLLENNVISALAIVNNIARQQPDIPLSPAARFLQALSYDLAADRSSARLAYFNLWTDYPNNLWGQLAAMHLERRGG